jgi:hypothetical protein
MTNCPVCQRDTPPVKIGGLLYCSICGTPAPAHSQPSQNPNKRLSLDLSPRSRGQVARQVETKDSTSRPQPQHPKAAAAEDLHRRVKPSRVLDLRASAKTTKPPKLATAPHHVPAAPPSATAKERHQAHVASRLEQAKQIPRSSVIRKFNGPRLSDPGTAKSIPAAPSTVIVASQPLRTLPEQAATHHQAMGRLIPAVVTAAQEPVRQSSNRSWRPHLGLSPNSNRTVATVAAVAIMAGYIWLQNYPKLALQNANSQAGITASLPSYIPSSYSLKTTDTGPGLVTLNFTSPSAAQALKIAQHRTTWDSSSLLDNYVAKATDDYATVQGQGLTIYLFNDNQAAWVNHGIWYSIQGASLLSREQILKIAYSL